MPAGAMPIPLRPNRTVTGPWIFSPLRGAMIYTSAPVVAGVRLCARARVASNIAPSTINGRFIEISFVWNCGWCGHLTTAPRLSRICGLLDQVLHPVPLFQQFAVRRRHFLAAELTDIQALHDAVLAALARHRIGVDHAFGDAVAAVG